MFALSFPRLGGCRRSRKTDSVALPHCEVVNGPFHEAQVIIPYLLLGEGEIIRREQAPIQRVAQVNDPGLMEIMKQTCVNASPVVSWHGITLPPATEAPL
jgi:hypothetical protein